MRAAESAAGLWPRLAGLAWLALAASGVLALLGTDHREIVIG